MIKAFNYYNWWAGVRAPGDSWRVFLYEKENLCGIDIKSKGTHGNDDKLCLVNSCMQPLHAHFFLPNMALFQKKRGVMVAMVSTLSRSSFKVYLLHKSTFRQVVIESTFSSGFSCKGPCPASYSYEWPIL